MNHPGFEDFVEDVRQRLDAGAREVSAVAPRAWGHHAGYSLDPDGHVLAFARVEPAR